jgi:hypothetical protein
LSRHGRIVVSFWLALKKPFLWGWFGEYGGLVDCARWGRASTQRVEAWWNGAAKNHVLLPGLELAKSNTVDDCTPAKPRFLCWNAKNVGI